MHIEANTDARLVLRQLPWRLWVVFGGLISVSIAAIVTDPSVTAMSRGLATAVGGAALVGLSWLLPMSTIVLDRSSGSLTVSERSLLGVRLRAYTLDQIAWAQVDTLWVSNSRGARLTVVIDDKRVPLERGAGPADRRTLETVLNEWLTRPVLATDQGHRL